MGPGGGAESIDRAFSPAGHLFVNLIKEKWLFLSSSCSLSAGEPILYGDVAAQTAFPCGAAGNQQGCRGAAAHPLLLLHCPGAGRTPPCAYKHISPLPRKGHSLMRHLLCQGMSRTCLISCKVNGGSFLVPLVRCGTDCMCHFPW